MVNVTKKLYLFCEWTVALFLLQVYWLGGVFIGGILFGIVPSSIALFATIRHLYLGKSNNGDTFNYFKQQYQKNFKYSFLIGGWYALSFMLVIVYLRFLSATVDSWMAYFHIFLYAFLLFVLLINIYLIPVFVHYEVPSKKLIPTAMNIMFVNMKWNLPLLLTLIALGLLFINHSVIFMFFGVSVPAFFIWYFCIRAFEQFDLKRNSL